jgi:hypothetical protein
MSDRNPGRQERNHRNPIDRARRRQQILFTILAVLIILSWVLALVINV